jgi:hypothetical protein
MLTVRNAQAEKLDTAAFGQLCERLTRHLQSAFTEELTRWGLGQSDLTDQVRTTLTQARGYGIQNVDDLRVYLELATTLGLDFVSDPRYPWAREIVTNTVYTGAEKIALLLDHFVFVVCGTIGRYGAR